MGVVSRVNSFQKAWKNVKSLKTVWGKLPVIGVRDLVEIKKTRRLEDYPIISNLVWSEYERLRPGKIKDSDWKWLLSNTFEVDNILHYIKNHRRARKICETLPRKSLQYCLKSIKESNKSKKHFASASKAMAIEIEKLRAKDRIYWRTIIDELKKLNREGRLLKAGKTIHIPNSI